MVANAAKNPPQDKLLLHLRENRSDLSQEARLTFTALICLFMAVAILPALKGQWLVPAFAIGTMALLVAAIEWHKTSRPAAEWLAISDGRLFYRRDGEDTLELPARWTRLVADDAMPARLQLFLETRMHKVEIGLCLNQDERQEIVPLIRPWLGETAR